MYLLRCCAGARRPRYRLPATSVPGTERFTRVDANTLNYEVKIEDPSTWTKPWTVSVPMVKNNETIYEYACHEGNYGLPGILAGARAQEAAAEEAAKKGSR